MRLADQPAELQYVVLLFLIFIVPRLLQRYGLPTAVTSVGLGALAGLGLGLFHEDHTVELLSTLGIVSLFLFAGLDVNLRELRRELPVLSQHIAVQLALFVGVAFLAEACFGLPFRPAALVSLALVTPSTGFILDSLGSLGVTDRERFWIKSKAIATEIVALIVLFVTLQSTSFADLALSTLVLAGMIAVLPLLFRAFARVVVPYAPKSEFAFLLMIAILCAFATRKLGVYYLVGAFVVGLTAQRFRERLPAITSEQMIHAVEMFASFFVPFYFFRAGLHLQRGDFGWEALGLGAVLLVALSLVRVAAVAIHRRFALGEPVRTGMRIGVSMLPTLVFTLVLADILRERFDISATLFGGLIVYTLANTLIPSFSLRLPPRGYDTLRAPAVALDGEAEPSPARRDAAAQAADLPPQPPHHPR
jgi:Kef-type K+ transport system membrane component KefB